MTRIKSLSEMAGEFKRMSLVFGLFVIFLSFCIHRFSESRAENFEWQELTTWIKDNSIQDYEHILKKLDVKSVEDLAVVEIETLGKNIDKKFKSAVQKARAEMELQYLLDLYEVSPKYFIKIKMTDNKTNIKELCSKLSDELNSKLHNLCLDFREGKIQPVESEKLKTWFNDQKKYTLLQFVYPDWYFQYLMNQYFLRLGNQGSNMAGGQATQPGAGQQISPFYPFLGPIYDPLDLNKK